MNVDLKKLKLSKKKELTKETLTQLRNAEQVEEVHQIKDNMLLIKVNLNNNIVYYRVVISEITKNVDDWLDLIEDYKLKKGVKNDKK